MTLRWSVTGPGNNDWLRQYDYGSDGRWVIRDASAETPFAEAVGRRLISALPSFNEVNEVTGTQLMFDDLELPLTLWEGEINTSPR